jgi:PIF1-like helicase
LLLNSIEFRPGRNLPIQTRNLADNSSTPPEQWLSSMISKLDSNCSTMLCIPTAGNGDLYSIEMLTQEQQQFVFVICDKLYEWLHCDNLQQFQPGRYTLVGPAGSGKSVVINTITTIFRLMFDYNNVIAGAGFTGNAAFNILGETLHRLFKLGICGEYKPFSLSAQQKAQLCHRFKHFLCLIIDERSLLSSKLLGTSAQVLSETIFDGCNIEDLLGGLPILILAGDDYQLPGMHEGAFEVLRNLRGASKMTCKGRQVFKECAQNVFHLRTVLRVQDDRLHDKELMQRVRLGTGITDADFEKIQSLHLSNIRENHGDEIVNRIEEDAVYVFWTNEKRVRHNFHRLSLMSSAHNPTAIIKPTGCNAKTGKSIASHFDSSITASLVCVGAKVCIQGKNFLPQWGLFNGVCGTVQEIVFAEGDNPNHGKHPKYVVVTFPQYVGPTWDLDNPKVTKTRLYPFSNISYLILSSVHHAGCSNAHDSNKMQERVLHQNFPSPRVILCKNASYFSRFKCW